MSKKVVNIVKNNKKKKDTNKSDIFNLNEEIIIGINSKKNIEDNKKNKHKKKTITKDSKKGKNGNKKNKSKKVEKKKMNKFLKFFIIIIILFIVFAAFLISPVFNINKITVKNNVHVSKDEIVSLSGIVLGENTFKYMNFELIDKIKENLYIEDVKIKRNFPSEIIIDVTERELTFCIKTGETYAYIDNQGYIIEIATDDFNLPEIIGYNTGVSNIVTGNRLIDKDLVQLEKVLAVYDYAKSNEINTKISNFNIADEVLAIQLQDEKIAYIKNISNLNIKILSLKAILEKTEGKAGEIFLDGHGQSQSVVFKERV